MKIQNSILSIKYMYNVQQFLAIGHNAKVSEIYSSQNYRLKTKLYIMQTCPCNVYPLTPYFYIVKLGLTGALLIDLFSYFCSKTYIVGTR